MCLRKFCSGIVDQVKFAEEAIYFSFQYSVIYKQQEFH